MLPFFLDFARPILHSLIDGKTAGLQQFIEQAIADFHLTEEDCAEMIKSQKKTQVNDRTSWAVSYLYQAGLIERVSRGHYKITEEGRKVYLSGNEITKEFLTKYKSFVDFQQRESKKDVIGDNPNQRNNATPSEAIEIAVNEINSSLVSELLELVKSQSPQFFEQLVVDLLRKMGYGQNGFTEVTRYTKDEGIDGIITEDKLGLNKVYLQAKRWNNGTVGRKDVTSFIGTLMSKSSKKGVFITTSSFSKEATDSLTHLPSDVSVVFIDGIRLAEYMIEFNLGVTVKKTYEVKRIDSDYFEEN